MRNTYNILTAFLGIVFLLTTQSILAQSKTYQLDIETFKTSYGALPSAGFPKDIIKELEGWKKGEGTTDLSVKITYQSGLMPKQYTKKKSAEGYNLYRVTVISPSFEAEVKAKDGRVLLKETYGNTKEFTLYGAELKTKNSKVISQNWWKEREMFYEEEEKESRYYADFMDDFSKLVSNNKENTIVEKDNATAIVSSGGKVEEGETKLSSEVLVREVKEEAQVVVREETKSTVEDEPQQEIKKVEKPETEIVKSPAPIKNTTAKVTNRNIGDVVRKIKAYELGQMPSSIPVVLEKEEKKEVKVKEIKPVPEEDQQALVKGNPDENPREIKNKKEIPEQGGLVKKKNKKYKAIDKEEEEDFADTDTDTDTDTESNEPTAHYRYYNKVLSVGVGPGNFRDYLKPKRPMIGISLDRYSLEHLFDIDWFFVGGWIGSGKYEYKDEPDIEVNELSFITRYGVSASRILQDVGYLNEVTNIVDAYAVLQFGYSFLTYEGVLADLDSGVNSGITIGGRVSLKHIGAFLEVGKTETGFVKAGVFFQL